jgi:hypothetical protein
MELASSASTPPDSTRACASGLPSAHTRTRSSRMTAVRTAVTPRIATSSHTSLMARDTDPGTAGRPVAAAEPSLMTLPRPRPPDG